MNCDSIIEKAVCEACVFIETHFREPLNLSRIAGHVGYSEYHFHRAFRDRKRVSLGEYILETRLRAARHLLLHSSQRIIDVALDVGFECPETFARAFRRFHAVAPSEFRRLDGVSLKRTRSAALWEQSQRRFAMPYEMVHLLSIAVDRKASDLTVAPGTPPHVCVGGSLDVVNGEAVAVADARPMFDSIASLKDQQCLDQTGKADFSFWFENIARFRVSAVNCGTLDAPIVRLFITDRNL